MKIAVHLLVILPLVLWNCSGSDPATAVPTDTANDQTGTPLPDIAPTEGVTEDTTGQDIAVAEDATDDTCVEGEGCFGESCTSNADCPTGWCVDHRGDSVCSDTCITECPQGFSCTQVQIPGGDVTYVCTSNAPTLCRPCVETSDCDSTNGGESACVQYGETGSFCGASCASDEDCPVDYACQDATAVTGATLLQCVRTTDECPCTDKSVELGASTHCSSTNDAGTCGGTRVCMADGLTACDAPNAVAETCNGADDNCDGTNDENTCDDNNPCTLDECVGAEGCQDPPTANVGLDCDDNDLNTTDDACDINGECHGTPLDCPTTQCSDATAVDGACETTHKPINTPCDDSDPATIDDVCDGNGACGGADTTCGDGVVQGLEICDDGNTSDGDCCSSTCALEATGTVCRAAASECDIVEVCTGSSASCPTDIQAAQGTACGDSTDSVCDAPDSCDGNGACQNNHADGNTVCNPTKSACDVTETCDGNGHCPSDGFAAQGTACGNDTSTTCNAPDSCDGNGACLPNHAASTTVCKAAKDACDVAENCDGAGNCPADAFAAQGTACGSSGSSTCNGADSCDGSGTCSPNYASATTVCNPVATACDVAETCDGAGNCPANVFKPAGTACDDSNGATIEDTCQNDGTCTGKATTCGDGKVEGLEECDDNTTGILTCAYGLNSCTICDANCQKSPGEVIGFCGDKIIQNKFETCDDGNQTKGDGCSDGCTDGSWCGAYVVNSGNNSILVAGKNVANILCKGHNPNVSCPAGYKILELQTAAANNDKAFDIFKTCVRNETKDAMLCGASILNGGFSNSLLMSGSTKANKVSCQGHDPMTTCPGGYDRVVLSLANNNTDSISDLLATCVKQKPLMDNACGARAVNTGTKPSIYIDGPAASKTYPCEGKNPSLNTCPAGYHFLDIQMTSFNDDSSADLFQTCIYGGNAVSTCGNGVVEGFEECDDAGACCNGCSLGSSKQVCRPAKGVCDQAENCTGSSSKCPADASAPDGTVCGPNNFPVASCFQLACKAGACGLTFDNCPSGQHCCEFGPNSFCQSDKFQCK